jgi:hypothetical protein
VAGFDFASPDKVSCLNQIAALTTAGGMEQDEDENRTRLTIQASGVDCMDGVGVARTTSPSLLLENCPPACLSVQRSAMSRDEIIRVQKECDDWKRG